MVMPQRPPLHEPPVEPSASPEVTFPQLASEHGAFGAGRVRGPVPTWSCCPYDPRCQVAAESTDLRWSQPDEQGSCSVWTRSMPEPAHSGTSARSMVGLFWLLTGIMSGTPA